MFIKVHNLSADFSDKQLLRIFEPYGLVLSAVVSRNQYNGRSNRHGMVEMLKAEDGEKAVSSLDGTVVEGKIISVTNKDF